MKDFRFDHTKIKKKAEPKPKAVKPPVISKKGYIQKPLLGKFKRTVKLGRGNRRL